jgi:hypothetical protein
MENANQVKLTLPFKNKHKLQEFMDTMFPRCSLKKDGAEGCFTIIKSKVNESPIFIPPKPNGEIHAE